MTALLARLRNGLEAVPYTLLALPLRLAVATVFWRSGLTKLANWDTAVALFADEYQVPLLPPERAAYMAASIESSTPVLLVLGLATRPAAAVLLGMTAVIEIFVYPVAWPTHIQWAAMLLVLLCRGPARCRSTTGCGSASAGAARQLPHILGKGLRRELQALHHRRVREQLVDEIVHGHAGTDGDGGRSG